MALLLPLKLAASPPSQQNTHPSSRLLPKPYASLLFSNARQQQQWRLSSIAAAQGTGSTAPALEAAEEISGKERRRLIAQNIPWTATADEIRSLFEKHGNVVDVELSMYNSSRNRGLAFVMMASEEDALAAVNNLNSYDLDGRVIKVEFSKSLKKTPSVSEQAPVPKYTVFIGNLAWRVRSQNLQDLFSGNYNVVSAEVIFQSKPRRSAGYGFVSFASKEEAEAAVASFNGKKFMGRPINLAFRNLEDADAKVEVDEDKQVDDSLNEKNAAILEQSS